MELEQGLLGQNEESEITGQGLVDNQHFHSILTHTTLPCKDRDQKCHRGMHAPMKDLFYHPTSRPEVLLTIPKVDATIVMTMTASERQISAVRVTEFYGSFTHELRLRRCECAIVISETTKNWYKSRTYL